VKTQQSIMVAPPAPITTSDEKSKLRYEGENNVRST